VSSVGRLDILKKALGIGVVTRKYPYVRVEPPEGFRGKPIIDPDKCLGCGACAEACPPKAISTEDSQEEGARYVKIFYGRCIFCGMCADVCPANAIELSKEFELASKERNDLYLVIKVPMVKCSICGKYFTTAPLLLKSLENVPEHLRPIMTVCPECKSKLSSRFTSFARRVGS